MTIALAASKKKKRLSPDLPRPDLLMATAPAASKKKNKNKKLPSENPGLDLRDWRGYQKCPSAPVAAKR
jgi:hypothetical protein